MQFYMAKDILLNRKRPKQLVNKNMAIPRHAIPETWPWLQDSEGWVKCESLLRWKFKIEEADLGNILATVKV